jgi:GTP cyclohydrolase II
LSGDEAARQAIAALRAGRAITVTGVQTATILPVETATPELLALLDPSRSAPLLLSGRRAAALNLANARDAADPASPVLIAREAWLDTATALDFADAGRDFARAHLGPLRPIALENARSAAAALRLLPAAWLLQAETPAAATIPLADAESGRVSMARVAAGRLPLARLEGVQLQIFRASDDGAEHAALVVGAFAGKPPLVRLHSECLTGDVFGSLKCDCGPQLRGALELIASEGAGVLLYLRQEGRGIGLANKIRAYALQDRGLDTVEANVRLGFADDERSYEAAAAILRALGLGAVRLLTNNPDKVAGLEKAGVAVIERVGHAMPANPHNADYLAVKRRKSGHLL